jgi:hypothetical protein
MTGGAHAEVPPQQDAETLRGKADGEPDESGTEAVFGTGRNWTHEATLARLELETRSEMGSAWMATQNPWHLISWYHLPFPEGVHVNASNSGP